MAAAVIQPAEPPPTINMLRIARSDTFAHIHKAYGHAPVSFMNVGDRV
jgi:hypothetical protein